MSPHPRITAALITLVLFVVLVMVGSTSDGRARTNVRLGTAACVVRTADGRVVHCK